MQTKGNMPDVRAHHACSVVGEWLIVTGGKNASSPSLADVHKLHLPTMTWTAVSLIAPQSGVDLLPRTSHVAEAVDCVTNKKMFLFGGKSSCTRLCDTSVACYNISEVRSFSSFHVAVRPSTNPWPTKRWIVRLLLVKQHGMNAVGMISL